MGGKIKNNIPAEDVYDIDRALHKGMSGHSMRRTSHVERAEMEKTI